MADETKAGKGKPGATSAANAKPAADGPAVDAAAPESPVNTPAADAAPVPPVATVTESQDSATSAPRFPRARLLGPDGVVIAGQPAAVVAGALAGSDEDAFTRDEIHTLVDQFLKAPVAPAAGDDAESTEG